MSAPKLDFRDLMSLAAANSHNKQREIEKHLYAREKKADPKQVKLKVGVQKFLQKKEEEERKLREEAARKKRMLLELRNQDRKATNRVKKMLNMTKSANKSCFANADQSLTEECAAQAGEIQPDEDDYGYTSQYAVEMHKKMMQKYQAAPKSSPFDKKKSSVEIPKAHSIERAKGSNGESKVNRSSGPSSGKNDTTNESHESKNANSEGDDGKSKKRKFRPPTESFMELLRLAEQKSKEPVVIKKTVEKEEDGPEFEFGRPMTAKEKAKYMSELAIRKRAESSAFLNSGVVPKDIPKTVESNVSKSKNIPDMKTKDSSKFSKEAPVAKVPEKIHSTSSMSSSRLPDNRANSSHMSDRNVPTPQQSSSSRGFGIPQNRPGPPPPAPKQSSSSAVPQSRVPVKPQAQQPKQNRDVRQPSDSRQYNETRQYNEPSARPHQPPTSSNRPKLSPVHNNQKPKKVVVPDPGYAKALFEKPQSRVPQNGHHTNGKRPPPPGRDEDDFVPRKKSDKFKGRQVIDSDEEEYDSEMDDFIDDSDIPGEDISSVIGQIFGYNKRKYANEESDDECMESSVHEQWREEQRSLRIGIKEDLEDIKREEEEKKRKMALMKKHRK